MVEIVLGLLGVYLGVGILFGVGFAFFGGAKALDESAVEGTWGFKLLIIPGAAAFWPLLLKRWVKGEGKPVERSAHRGGRRSIQ
ncbi:MAG: hypothetical protein AAF591_14570 [Verrucomicrobiota bacterium]